MSKIGAPPSWELRRVISGLEGKMRLFEHDIRSALTDVVDGLSILDPWELGDEARLHLVRARAAGATLSRLFDAAIQDVFPGGAGAHAEGQRAPVLQVLEDIGDRWAGHCQAKGMRLLIECGPIPEGVEAERLALERVLGNLIGNAIAHVGRGDVRLSLAAEEDRLVITVADQGPGYPPDCLESAQDDATEGLGLIIARGICARLGGALVLRNGPEGAVATASIPMLWPVLVQAADISGKRVLLVEDSPGGRLLVGQMLETLGAPHTAFADGERAAEAALGEYDLAVIDIELPGLSGSQLIQTLRTNPAWGARPILALTAHTRGAKHAAILDAGADGILTKPVIEPAHLANAIARALNISALKDTTEARIRRLFTVAGPGFETQLRHHLSDDLNQSRRALATSYAEQDASGLARASHVLVGVAGTLGANRLTAAARALNEDAEAGDLTTVPLRLAEIMPLIDRALGVIARAPSERAS